MTETVTITHHASKPEYQWEIVVPEGPTVLLRDENLARALQVLGLNGDTAVQQEIEALPNGGSRSVNAEVDGPQSRELTELGVKTVMQS
jgi:hypothetical protein